LVKIILTYKDKSKECSKNLLQKGEKMTNLYLMHLKNSESYTQSCVKLLENYSQTHKNITIFHPVIKDDELTKSKEILKDLKLKENENLYSFTLDKALDCFNKDPHSFFNKILQDYENLKCKYDFILVVGFKEFGILSNLELNNKIVKNLNTPVIALVDQNNKTSALNYFNNILKGKNHIVDENLDFEKIKNLKAYDFLTPYRFKFKLIAQSIKNQKTIVLPESDDERILKASAILLESKIVKLILLGDEKQIKENAKKLNLNLEGINIINPCNCDLSEEFSTLLYEARKAKGMSKEEAQKLAKDRTYFGTMLIHTNRADAMVSGASTTTAETIRPALQLIKTKEGVGSVSGIFFMGLEDQILAFADCAVNPNPNATELAASAYISAQSAKAFGLDPKIAMLSYSSGDSGKGESVELVKEALAIAKEKYPDLEIDGPLQFDAAYDAKTAAKKMPNSTVAGKATVYIFPDLDAANICYKAVQRTANALAIGPILQGLKKPVNDLSRGCLVDDIVDTVILSAIQAQ